MRYLFNTWNKISSDIKTAGHILLVLDYDGTITPIVDKPERAKLTEDTRDVIRSLANLSFFTVGIISGRSLADVKKKTVIDNIYYGGNHGLEIEGPVAKFTSPDAKELIPLMVLIERELKKELKNIKGVFAENKSLTLSLHYRRVGKKQVSIVKDVFDKVVGPLVDKGRVKVTSGKKVWEVRPPLELNKGKALLWIMRNLSFTHHNIFPIYIGDDQTDESAFELVNKKIGVSIFVGENNFDSCAKYYLKSPKEVKVFLKKMKRISEIK